MHDSHRASGACACLTRLIVLAILITLFGTLAALAHADRHLSRHQDPGHRGGVDLSRPVARRHGRPCHLLLRAPALDGRQRHRAHRKPVADRHRHRQNLLPARASTSAPPPRRSTSMSQTVLKQMPPGITPPLILNYNASTVPIIQLALSSHEAAGTEAVRPGPEFHSSVACDRARARPCLRPMAARNGRSRSTSIRQALQAKGLSAEGRRERASPPRTRSSRPARRKSGQFEYNVKLNDSPATVDELNDLPIKTVNGTTIYIRDVAHVRDGFPPQRNVVRMDGRRARADDGPEERARPRRSTSSTASRRCCRG